jgi:hypothetical protein
MTVLARMGSDAPTVNKVTGSIAALVKESVWESLLKGETVGVQEPDPERYSLFVGHHHVETFKSLSMRHAIKKTRMKRMFLHNVEWDVVQDATYGEVGMVNPEGGLIVYILHGYPDALSLSQEKIKAYQDHGLDAKKCAEKIRGLVGRAFTGAGKYAGALAYMDEIDRGMERQGRD